MSIAPQVVEPTDRVNNYTVIVDQGAEDGVSEGDLVLIAVGDNENLRARVIDVSQHRSVAEIETV